MRAFIVRPFGVKSDIDFDKVQEKLIIPALNRAGIEGYTTGVILEAGNIRQDMFQLLLTSDLVIADISIHNANVFYELGIRHALRKGRTILIRCRKDDVPFDLKTDRYLAYEYEDLESSVNLLYESIKATRNSEEKDSPVFAMLPNLQSQDPEDFLAVPRDFADEVYLAERTQQRGKLALLATEVGFFKWEMPAWRIIGKIQFKSKFYKDAKETWEKVRKRKADDIEANEFLATIYHRLAETEAIGNPAIEQKLLAKSEQAINRLFNQFGFLDKDQCAEAYSLRARNEKAKWLRRWAHLEPEKIGKLALRSSSLFQAYKNYSLGYHENLNHFYSGINALGLLKVIITLAERESVAWGSKFESAADAESVLNRHRIEFNDLAIVIRKAIASAQKTLDRDELTDPWVSISAADLALLTSDNPDRVAYLYCMAVESGTNLNFDAAIRQVLLYKKLGIAPENVGAALKEFDSSPIEQEEVHKKVILFTGHMIDRKDRAKPRFPKEKEDDVRKRIKKEIEKIVNPKESSKNIIGIAGGACGGDILFHEVCKELGIKTDMYLALPSDKFIVESVKFAGNGWIDRFNTLYTDSNTLVLADQKELPAWLQSKKEYSFWERNNLWILHSALSYGGSDLTLLALWDGKKGDGSGGTEHMIKEVEKRGAKSVVISL